MIGEAIANFDSYVYVAIGMFVVGLFAVLVYEKTSSARQQPVSDASDKKS